MEQELGNGWSNGIHPEDLRKLPQTYRSAFDAREPFVMQYRLRDARWAISLDDGPGVPRYGPRGNFRGYVGACVDITDLLEKDRALREIEDRVALAAEVAHLGVWELDTTTYDLWISDKGRKLFGFEPDGPISYAAFQNRVHPEDRTRRASAIKRAIETQGGYELEYRFLLPDGSVRWIGGRGHCVSDKDGRLTRLVGVSMDTTDLKQAQQLFQLATEASPSGVVLADAEGRIVLVNAHVEELFGYGRDELVGKSVEILVRERFALYAPANRDEFFAEAQGRAAGAGRELLALRKDGSEFPVEIDLNPIQTPQGSLVLASIVDISARKLAEEEAQRRRDEIDLLTRVSLLGEMTASIAHEVNQPLSGIISNAGAGERFIDRGNVNLEQLREILVDIGADGRRAYNVMQNIRNTVKRGGAIRERLSINDVVMHVAHLIQPDAAAHSCHLQISLADELPAVNGDPIQIQQVLVNLIGNAFDAMQETALENRKVEVSTGRNGDQTIVLSVRDHGMGIDEKARSRLFERFYTTKPDGLGMGLAIVRSIIEAHDGTIVAENARRRRCLLLRHIADKQVTVKMTVAPSLVFVIDDDPSARKGLSRLLNSADYESEVFESAEDFLDHPPHPGPACIIVDVQMPGLNGLEFQETLIRRRREEQLIFITGHGDIPMCARVMKAGAVDFLPKPFRPGELLKCVERALARSAEQRRIAAEKNEARELLDLLTPREFEVMQLVATGLLNKQVGGELGMAEKTVKLHRGRAMHKLRITSVAQLVRLIEKAGAAPFTPHQTKV